MTPDIEDEFLFNPSILEKIDEQFNESTIFDKLKERYKLRPLKRGDFNRGYLKLLSQLTTSDNISISDFHDQFDKIKSTIGHYYIIVVEDSILDAIVATATLFIERKFIHGCGLRARIEDVVVDKEIRGQGFGRILIEYHKLLAQYLSCYKLTLECDDKNVGFYNAFGFKEEKGRSNHLTIRFQLD